jgi:predicted DNA-binding transcriptional regulator YafY
MIGSMPRPDQPVARKVLRLNTLLAMIPRGKRRAKTTKELEDALDSARVARSEPWRKVSPRTFERDLKELAETYDGLCRDDVSTPPRWYWAADAAPPEGVPMTVAQALALSMAEQHLRHLLPKSNLADLEPIFVAARKALAQSRKHAGWAEKIRVEGLGWDAAPPVILPEVQRQVTEALLMERRCRVAYRKPGRTTIKEFDVNPLGLLVRNGTVSLVSTKVEPEPGEEGPRQRHLHRMASAKCLEDIRQVPRGFSLADFDVGGGDGVTALRGCKAMQIKLLVHPKAPFWPDERPLPKQEIRTLADGRTVVEAKVPNTKEFLAWLRGYGPTLEVLEPTELRDQLADEARQIAGRHDRR